MAFSILGIDGKLTKCLVLIGGPIVIYLILSLVQNLYFSPLSKFPGPFLWKAYRLRFVYSLISGNYVKDVRAIHEKYGDIVRLAPNEVSFAREDAWAQILSGPKHFPRNRLWYKPPLEQPDNIITTPNNADSSRMRRLIGRGMSVNACKKQEPIVQSYVDSFMSKLHALALSSSIDEKGPAGGTVNVTDWFNFFTFDVTGDLSFGESFDCLSDGKLHPWVFAIFKYIKGMAIAASARFYPFIEKLLLRCMPESIRRAHREHYQFTVDRVHKRLALGHERDDFMSSVIRDNKNFQNMSLPEIESTFAILVIAGSETTATTLAGTTNYLIQNPLELERLTAEVRSTFKMKEDITVAALEQLPILTATINEGLRLCNPVPAGIPYVVPKGGAWVCGHFLPEMTNVSIHPASISRSPKYFTKPNSFLSQRWLPADQRPAEFANDHLGAIKPFSLGPRSCLGQALAWMQMRMVLARLVWEFDISMAEGRRLDWTDLKTWMIIEKAPVMVRLDAKR